MSLPYHIGNGWFGGMLPLTAAALVTAKGHIYAGLWSPVIVAAITFVSGRSSSTRRATTASTRFSDAVEPAQTSTYRRGDTVVRLIGPPPPLCALRERPDLWRQ
jgi:hypothetical protein